MEKIIIHLKSGEIFTPKKTETRDVVWLTYALNTKKFIYFGSTIISTDQIKYIVPADATT